MDLDENVIEGLHLLSSGTNPDSLFNVLNHTVTVAGERMLTEWIRKPLKEVVSIQKRLDIVELFIDLKHLRENISCNLKRGSSDVKKLIAKFDKDKATLEDLHKVSRLLATLF